jgi:hypothetical protein
VAVDPIRPVGPRPDLAPLERVRLTPAERDEERRERERRRRRAASTRPAPPAEDGPGGLDIRV